MKKSEIKKEKYYATRGGLILLCLDLGEGRFPRVPKFRTVFPFAGQERYIEAREIEREISDRELAAYQKQGGAA